MLPTVQLICAVLFACVLLLSNVRETAGQQAGLANLKQAHAQRWLEENRASLSQRQIDLVIEAIAFLSADRNRHDREARKYGDELKRRLTCELGRARVTAAFTFLDPPRQSWSTSVDEWLAWFPDCVLGAQGFDVAI